MKGIILHGGHGTRLRPLTHTGPKQLLPIANKPMSEYCVETLIEAGITDIAFIIGGIGADKVKEYYGDGTKYGANFSYIQQDYPKGIAHAVSLCKDFVGNEKFIVFLGDNIIQRSISEYLLKRIKIKNKFIKEIFKSKSYVKKECEKRNLEFINTETNFIYIKLPSNKVNKIYKKLINNKILVRPTFKSAFKNLRNTIRITLGEKKLMEKFFDILDKVKT